MSVAVGTTVDPLWVLGAFQAIEDAWWTLHSSHVQGWEGPGSVRAEEQRVSLMSRVADARDQLGELHALSVTLNELEAVLAVRGGG